MYTVGLDVDTRACKFNVLRCGAFGSSIKVCVF
jgi:hypothetical protein